MDATSSFFCCLVFSVAFSLGLVNAYELAANQTLADRVPHHKTHLNLEEERVYVCLYVRRCVLKHSKCCVLLRRKGSRNGKDVCYKQFSKGTDTDVCAIVVATKTT